MIIIKIFTDTCNVSEETKHCPDFQLDPSSKFNPNFLDSSYLDTKTGWREVKLTLGQRPKRATKRMKMTRRRITKVYSNKT